MFWLFRILRFAQDDSFRGCPLSDAGVGVPYIMNAGVGAPYITDRISGSPSVIKIVFS